MTESLTADTLVKVRCATHAGPGSVSDHHAIARRLVELVLADIDTYKHPPRLLLLLATPGWCHPSKPLSREIRDQFENVIGYRPPLVGGSAPTIFCSQPCPQVIDEGIVLVAILTAEMKVSVRHLAAPYTEALKPREDEIREMVNGLRADRNLDIALGTSAQWALLGFLPGFIQVGDENDWSYRDGDLCNAIAAVGGYSLFAVSPSMKAGITSRGFQFGNDVCLESGLVLGLVEHDLNIGSWIEHGFSPVRDHAGLRIDSLMDGEESADGSISGYLVGEMNGKPARAVIDAIGREGQTNQRPPIGMRQGLQYEVNLPLPSGSRSDGAVRMKNRVFVGDWYVPMTCDPVAMAKACDKGMRHAEERAGAVNQTAFLIEFAGGGRDVFYRKQGKSWGEVMAEVAAKFSGIPVVGALCAGEFAEYRGRSNPANAHSVWFMCISTERNYRGKNRGELQRIHAAAKDLVTCSTPEEVMQSALKGAIAAGAEGGCISRTDAGTGRILGGTGMAKSEDAPKQKWHLAPDAIDYPAPERRCDKRIPNYMAPWVKPALTGAETVLTPDATRENILEIVVRTEHALFLPNPDLFPNNRNPQAIENVGIEAELMVPLIGLGEPGGRVIGVIQIGLPLGVTIDDELFYYWIGFAQKVAASLERAEERVQRETVTRISKLGTKYCQKVADLRNEPKKVMEDFVIEIQKILESDYAHLRVRMGGQETYELVAPDTRIGRVHREARPTIHKNSGSCRQLLLDSPSGTFANTGGNRSWANELSKNAASEAERALVGIARSFESFGVVRLIRRGAIVGSFVVESRSRYFFTEYRSDLVRAAAREVEQILVEYEKRRQADRLHKLRNDVVDPLIRVSELGAEWLPLLLVIKEGFCVDAATIILGQDDPEIRSTLDPHPEPPDIGRPLHFLEGPLAREDGREIVAPLLSPINEYRGVLWLRFKSANATDHHTFDDRAEQDAVMEVARYIASAVGFWRNLAKIDEFEAKLSVQNRLAAGGLFAASVMHDLNTPLSKIMRSIDVLRMSPEMSPGEREREYDFVEASKEAAVELIQRVAALPTMGKAVYPLSQVISLAIDFVTRENEFPQVELSVENSVHALVRIDLWSMVSALLNLISNALNAAANDGGRVTVSSRNAAESSCVTIRIHNSGRAYTSLEIEKFVLRGETNKTGPHLGLGVNIALQAFRDSGGRCDLRPANGNGVEALCVLPVAPRSEIAE